MGDSSHLGLEGKLLEQPTEEELGPGQALPGHLFLPRKKRTSLSSLFTALELVRNREGRNTSPSPIPPEGVLGNRVLSAHKEALYDGVGRDGRAVDSDFLSTEVGNTIWNKIAVALHLHQCCLR